jgi:hypothetical protein
VVNLVHAGCSAAIADQGRIVPAFHFRNRVEQPIHLI